MYSWGRKSFLPAPEGPYVPGCIDVMTEYSSDGSFFRLFYPSSLPKTYDWKSHSVPWMAHVNYARGFAYILGIWFFLLKVALWIVSGVLYIPAVYDAPIKKGSDKFPVIVFSHGLGACRFFYSSTYAELASHGLIVAALEHRDASACISYYYASPEDRNRNKRTWVYHHKLGFGAANWPARVKQVHTRAEECSRALSVLEKINKGGSVENVAGNNSLLQELKGRLNMVTPVLMGHSFGGAASLLTLSRDDRFKLGIILDCWMYPIRDETRLAEKISQPLLFVNTETFHIESNLTALQKYIDSPKNTHREVYTMRKTTHENQTDTVYLIGYWLDWKMKKLDPVIATRINHQLILRFLRQNLGFDISVNEEFLDTERENIVDGLYSSHVKPKSKL